MHKVPVEDVDGCLVTRPEVVVKESEAELVGRRSEVVQASANLDDPAAVQPYFSVVQSSRQIDGQLDLVVCEAGLHLVQSVELGLLVVLIGSGCQDDPSQARTPLLEKFAKAHKVLNLVDGTYVWVVHLNGSHRVVEQVAEDLLVAVARGATLDVDLLVVSSRCFLFPNLLLDAFSSVHVSFGPISQVISFDDICRFFDGVHKKLDSFLVANER